MNPIALFVIVTVVGSIMGSVFAVMVFIKAQGLSDFDDARYNITGFIAAVVAEVVNAHYSDHHHLASIVSMVIQLVIALGVLTLNRRSVTKPTTT